MWAVQDQCPGQDQFVLCLIAESNHGLGLLGMRVLELVPLVCHDHPGVECKQLLFQQPHRLVVYDDNAERGAGCWGGRLHPGVEGNLLTFVCKSAG